MPHLMKRSVILGSTFVRDKPGNLPRPGLTLIELLIVIAVIAVLLAIMIPAVQRIREHSRGTACANNLKQIGLAISQYSVTHREHIPASWRTIRDSTGQRQAGPSPEYLVHSFSWRTTILPYLEQQSLSDALNYGTHLTSPLNSNAVATIVSVYQCPSTPGSPRSFVPDGSQSGLPVAAADYSHIHWVANESDHRYDAINHSTALAGAWFGRDLFAHGGPGQVAWSRPNAGGPASLAHIRDGLSNTILVAEKAGFPVLYAQGDRHGEWPWGQGTWAGCDLGGYGNARVNWSNFPSIFAFHPSGAHVVMCDGSVRFLAEDTDEGIIVALCSRSEGELAEL